MKKNDVKKNWPGEQKGRQHNCLLRWVFLEICSAALKKLLLRYTSKSEKIQHNHRTKALQGLDLRMENLITLSVIGESTVVRAMTPIISLTHLSYLI